MSAAHTNHSAVFEVTARRHAAAPVVAIQQASVRRPTPELRYRREARMVTPTATTAVLMAAAHARSFTVVPTMAMTVAVTAIEGQRSHMTDRTRSAAWKKVLITFICPAAIPAMPSGNSNTWKWSYD